MTEPAAKKPRKRKPKGPFSDELIDQLLACCQAIHDHVRRTIHNPRRQPVTNPDLAHKNTDTPAPTRTNIILPFLCVPCESSVPSVLKNQRIDLGAASSSPNESPDPVLHVSSD